jgi:pyruvate-ferredoxin/flavodoxin oxidoreductase
LGHQFITVDGNEAAARIAHAVSEVIAIYPITPASPMGELADAWSQERRPNIWGTVPEVIEMQSEGGAAGAVHGSLQAGALTTTFTASQGLLLMIPNMYKVAGELSPTVIHVAARTIATHALSIFGDHSDVMAARGTGFAMLASNSPEEAQDLALVAHAATLHSRVPFLHFFDGFRTSHEVAKIEGVGDDEIAAMIDDSAVADHRLRSLNPHRPVLRGSAQNPDVFFQAREAASPFYAAVPDMVQEEMDRFSSLTGRSYHLFDYHGAPDADRVIVCMGSGVGAVTEAVDGLLAVGEKVGVVAVRLYRPFSPRALVAVLPPTTTSIAVLDRCKEPGAVGEPLYQDVVAALAEEPLETSPRIIGGRFGLASKEFTPAAALAVFSELEAESPKNHFTVGITDDVSGTSLPVGEWSESDDVVRAVFVGLGADGTVGANKNSVKIIGEYTDQYAQGYFVYDSKKSGSTTISHLRFGPRPINSTYLVNEATFVACHQFGLLDTIDVMDYAAPGATFLLNSPFGPEGTWDHLSPQVQHQIVEKGLEVHVVDAHRIAADAGLAGRVNTVLQTCFFALTDVLPTAEAIAAIKQAIADTYGKRGEVIVERNNAAVDGAVAGLHRLEVPAGTPGLPPPPVVPVDPAELVARQIMAGKGDLLPVSAMAVDGTFETGTARWEKRSIADEIPIWDPSICIDCARCALVCPHAAIRMKVFDEGALQDAPSGFLAKPWEKGKDFVGQQMTIQVAPDDCTGCGVCVSICPAKSKEEVRHRSINMEPKEDHLARERANWDFFLSIPDVDRSLARSDTVVGSQALEPLFEFSGACSGCGETPYLKLLTQMFGDRLVVANATGCSSIFGGNLPTTPWAKTADGLGPAWSNSLFEDNAEFGLGMRLAHDNMRVAAEESLHRLASQLGDDFVAEILDAPQTNDAELAAQRDRVAALRKQLADIEDTEAERLDSLADALVRTDVWIVGGDGWAYDIGFGGLDHVLATGRNVNILVLDTEVYSNTGGQASKATPRAAVAKFAAGGKATGKKDLGMIAMAYGNVYVAQIAMGANMRQTVKAFAEAEAHPGPSLIIAYSPCIAHGIDMETMMTHQKEAADSGYWPLYRFDPALASDGGHPFRLDSREPTIPFKEFAMKEARFAMLARANPDESERLMDLAQTDIDDRWHYYEQAEDIEWTALPDVATEDAPEEVEE